MFSLEVLLVIWVIGILGLSGIVGSVGYLVFSALGQVIFKSKEERIAQSRLRDIKEF